MTTIAFRDGYLVADTQMTEGSLATMVPNFKLFKSGGYAVGFSGDLRYAPLARAWFEAGCPAGEPEFDRLWEDDHSILAMDKEGRLYIPFADRLVELPLEFYAAGSGLCFAMGAMAMGASAMDAVKIAACFDVYTNSHIEIIHRLDLCDPLLLTDEVVS